MRALLHAAETVLEDVRGWRRALHEWPELGFELPRTTALVRKCLDSWRITHRDCPRGAGIVADIEVPGATRRIALRADMDALAVCENSGEPFSSQVEGRAHLCGHDSHTAMLLGAARLMAERREQLPVSVRLLFQASEEQLPGGAKGMVEDGALEGVSEVYALHVWPTLETGRLGLVRGPVFGMVDMFSVQIHGKGGHGARPERARDCIVAAAEVVLALQTIVSRRCDPLQPAVVSVCQLHAGSNGNALPEEAFFEGTVRSFVPEQKQLVREAIEQIVAGVCAAHGLRHTLSYREGYPVSVNDPAALLRVEAALGSEIKLETVQPALVAEDFSYMLHQAPGALLLLGCRNEQKDAVHFCHDARFKLDEDALLYGVATHLGLALHAEAHAHE